MAWILVLSAALHLIYAAWYTFTGAQFHIGPYNYWELGVGLSFLSLGLTVFRARLAWKKGSAGFILGALAFFSVIFNLALVFEYFFTDLRSKILFAEEVYTRIRVLDGFSIAIAFVIAEAFEAERLPPPDVRGFAQQVWAYVRSYFGQRLFLLLLALFNVAVLKYLYELVRGILVSDPIDYFILVVVLGVLRLIGKPNYQGDTLTLLFLNWWSLGMNLITGVAILLIPMAQPSEGMYLGAFIGITILRLAEAGALVRMFLISRASPRPRKEEKEPRRAKDNRKN